MHRSRAIFAGITVLAACACGTSSDLASLGIYLGLSGPSGIYYVAILTAGSLLFVGGLGRAARAWPPAFLFLALLAAAGLLAPPRVMSDEAVHSAGNLIGFVLYLGATAALIWTLLQLYPTPVSWPLLGGLASGALAIGCTCCLTPGAIRYLSLAGGLRPSWLVSRFALVALGTVVGSLALIRAGKETSLRYFWGGILVVYPVEKLAEVLVPTWQAGGANLTFLIRYPLFLVGTGLIVFGVGRLLGERAEPARVMGDGLLGG